MYSDSSHPSLWTAEPEHLSHKEGNVFMKQPMVTVVVMTYQHAEYISECLDGIMNQRTSFPIHALVVDDASTDGTAEIVAEYARRYPEIVEAVLLKENMYHLASKTRTIVLPRIKGKYTAFCEGDDYWTHPDKLQTQVEFMENHPGYSACFQLYNIKNEVCMKFPPKARMRRSRQVSKREVTIEHMCHTNTIMFRSAIYESPKFWKFYPDVYPITDILLFAVLADAGSIWGINEYWSVYRLHNRGIYTSEKLKAGDSTYLIERKFIDLYYGRKHPMGRWMTLYERLERWTLLRRSGKYMRAIWQLFQAALYNPIGFMRLYISRYLL